MINRSVIVAICIFFAATMFSGCSSKQKTSGQGMVSVVAQNVVKIAGVKAMQDANLSALQGKKVYVRTTGFVDKHSEGFINNLVRSEVEDAGALLVIQELADIIVEAAVNSAGNDMGSTKIPLISQAVRSEGTVDLDLTFRDNKTGLRISKQQVIGHSKYEQGEFIGISGSGQYYVKNGDDFVRVPNPSAY